MRLVSRQSDYRCLVMSPIFVGHGYVAIARGVPLWLRGSSSVITIWAAFQLVQYLCCVRRWTRIGDRLEIPTLRQPKRHLSIKPCAELEIVEHGFARTLHVGPAYEDETPRLAINMFVSRGDLGRWAQTIGDCGSADDEDRG